MKKAVLLFIISFFITFAKGQNSYVRRIRDSLKLLLQTEKTDTGRVLRLFELCTYYEVYPDSAIILARQGLALSRKQGFVKGESMSLGRLGDTYRISGDFSKAMEYYLQSLKLSQKIKAIGGLYHNYNSIGLIYSNLGDYKQALTYLFKAKSLSEKNKDDGFTAGTSSNIAETYYLAQKYDSARYFIQIAYNIGKKTQNITQLSNADRVIGEINLATGQNTLALKYFRESALFKDRNRYLCRSYLGLAKVFENIGPSDSVFFYATRSFAIAKPSKFTLELRDAARLLSFYYRKHNADSAFFYQDISKAANDAIFDQQKQRQIQSLIIDERLHQQEIEAADAKYQSRQQKILLIFVMAGLIAAVVFSVVILINNKQKQLAYKELQKQQNELKSTQAQLIQSEKMASLGELTAGIAHEIQNPLNFVNNFSEVNQEMIDELEEELNSGNIEEALAIAADIKQNEQKINHHGKRADAIVKGMLEHSRAGSGVKEPTDINKLADEYLRLSYHGLRAKDKSFNAELVTNFDVNLPKINVIPQDMGRVFLNLFNNAFYAVSKKQKMAEEGYKPEISVSTATENGQVIIKVQDNGVGIPEQIKEKIMQPFFTTKPTGEGTGLGLSLTYDMVVNGHGGSIEVNAKEGEFTEFTITLSVPEKS